MADIPLIWTTKGNVPVDSLRYRHQWIDTADETTFVEEYLDGEEIVKRNVHVFLKKGLSATSVVGGVG